jgi:GTP cyclohydrolase I
MATYNYKPEEIVEKFLLAIGEDPTREGLSETPHRVVKAWETWFGGYKIDPKDVMKVFADGAEHCDGDEMVVRLNIPVYTHCEHHVAPFFGVAHVGYIPHGKVLGLSKLDRVVDIFARRLQVQERLTNQIADAIYENLQPIGVGVQLRCRHMCVESRGVKSHDSLTVTSALRGVMRTQAETRAEFMELCK